MTAEDATGFEQRETAMQGLREDAKPGWPSAARLHPLIAERLDALHALAAEDGISVDPSSEAALSRFVDAERVTQRPAIALLDSGEVRAVWQSSLGQVGLRFMPEGRIAYVCFAERDGDTARAYGTDTPDRVSAIVETMGLRRLLNG